METFQHQRQDTTEINDFSGISYDETFQEDPLYEDEDWLYDVVDDDVDVGYDDEGDPKRRQQDNDDQFVDLGGDMEDGGASSTSQGSHDQDMSDRDQKISTTTANVGAGMTGLTLLEQGRRTIKNDKVQGGMQLAGGVSKLGQGVTGVTSQVLSDEDTSTKLGTGSGVLGGVGDTLNFGQTLYGSGKQGMDWVKDKDKRDRKSGDGRGGRRVYDGVETGMKTARSGMNAVRGVSSGLGGLGVEGGSQFASGLGLGMYGGLGIVTGGMGMMKGAKKTGENQSHKERMEEMSDRVHREHDDETTRSELGDTVDIISDVNRKKRNRGGMETVTGGLDVMVGVTSITASTGVGGMVSMGLAGVSGGLKLGSTGVRTAKHKLRDRKRGDDATTYFKVEKAMNAIGLDPWAYDVTDPTVRAQLLAYSPEAPFDEDPYYDDLGYDDPLFEELGYGTDDYVEPTIEELYPSGYLTEAEIDTYHRLRLERHEREVDEYDEQTATGMDKLKKKAKNFKKYFGKSDFMRTTTAKDEKYNKVADTILDALDDGNEADAYEMLAALDMPQQYLETNFWDNEAGEWRMDALRTKIIKKLKER